MKYFKEGFQSVRITQGTCRGKVSQVVQNFNTLNHNSNIGWRSGGITSLNIDAVDTKGDFSSSLGFLYTEETARRKTIILENVLPTQFS